MHLFERQKSYCIWSSDFGCGAEIGFHRQRSHEYVRVHLHSSMHPCMHHIMYPEKEREENPCLREKERIYMRKRLYEKDNIRERDIYRRERIHVREKIFMGARVHMIQRIYTGESVYENIWKRGYM